MKLEMCLSFQLTSMKLTCSHHSIEFSEPPLNEEDVPPGEWLCPRCRALRDIKGMIDKKRKSNHGSNRGLQDKKKSATINESKNLNCTTTNEHPNLENSHKVRILSSLTARKNPFADLVRISLLLNPREFELPEDYIPDIQFPGTSKKPVINTATREARLSSYSVKRAQELDRDNLPSILRTCYFCRRGYRKAPLVHCDYCPLVYHADCIDPPLTTLPSTRWMCPNHVEPIAEEKLLSSSSFSERVKLWSLFSKPVDHESIKVRFLDKVHRSSSLDSKNKNANWLTSNRLTKDYEKFYVDNEKGEAILNNDIVSEKIRHDEQDDNFRMNLAFRQMIESSKLLETEDYQKTNGDKDIHCKNLSATTSGDSDAKEREEWLDFLLRLSNSDLRENDLKQTEAQTIKTSCNISTKQEHHAKSSEFNIPTNNIKLNIWPNNNVFNSKNNSKPMT